jgi:hypothetical protein
MLESIYKAHDGHLETYKNGVRVETELIASEDRLRDLLSNFN